MLFWKAIIDCRRGKAHFSEDDSIEPTNIISNARDMRGDDMANNNVIVIVLTLIIRAVGAL